MTELTTWARWQWPHKGLGRWHRLFADGDLTKTACQSPRSGPDHVAAESTSRPTSGSICMVCSNLDDILQRVMAGKLTDAVATTTAPMTLPERPLAPVGMACGCGCDKSEAAVAYRLELAAWEEETRAIKRAQFEAYVETGVLPEKETVA